MVPQPLSVRLGQSSCRLLALPQKDLPTQGWNAWVVHRHPSAGSLGGNVAMFHVAAVGFVLLLLCLGFVQVHRRILLWQFIYASIHTFNSAVPENVWCVHEFYRDIESKCDQICKNLHISFFFLNFNNIFVIYKPKLMPQQSFSFMHQNLLELQSYKVAKLERLILYS